MWEEVFPVSEKTFRQVYKRGLAISVDGKIFGPYERNLSNTFPLNGKTFCRVSNFSVIPCSHINLNPSPNPNPNPNQRFICHVFD